MANSSNEWYFTKEQLESTPSRQCGVEPYKELSYRQQASDFIQDMGQKLKVSQLCINTAIVYMHRFYVFHSFTRFQWNSIATAALFLAAKVEEQPRSLKHVIQVVSTAQNPDENSSHTNSERYLAQEQDLLLFNENILLQTLGFDVAIDHAHTHVVRCCRLVRASKDLAQTSYFMASNSLCLTTMCVQYKPTVVACFCIYFACKRSNWEISLSNEKKEWFSYVDETVTSELLEQLTKEFLFIYDRCPSRLKEKIMAIGDGRSLLHNFGHPSSPFEPDKKSLTFPSSDQRDVNGHRSLHGNSKSLTMQNFKHTPRLQHEPGSSGQHRDREREYQEENDRERLRHHIKPPPPNTSSGKHKPPQHGHQGHPLVDTKLSNRSSHPDASPSKVSKSNHNRPSAPKTANNFYNKVIKQNNNVGDPTMHTVQTLYNGVNYMIYPGNASQNAPPNYYYNYYPPPNMQLPTNMNIPPPFMYQQYYPSSYVYPWAYLYAAPNNSLGGEAPPPFPQDSPPNNPPPPLPLPPNNPPSPPPPPPPDC